MECPNLGIIDELLEKSMFIIAHIISQQNYSKLTLLEKKCYKDGDKWTKEYEYI